MADTLNASFVKRFPTGATVRAELRLGHASAAHRPGLTVLLGPSGCGKTTVLRCLAGLERPEEGRIEFGGEVWFDAQRGICLPPQKRGIGFVFQDYGLFPHLTVAGNIGFGLGHFSADERQRRVASMLERLELGQVLGQRPRQLSGGQQQRVALARALVLQPRLLLLDEPFAALDPASRDASRGALRHLLGECDIPVILVTHDRAEALALGDELVVMSAGQVQQSGPLLSVFNQPANPDVARIVGIETLQPGLLLEVNDGLATVRVGAAKIIALAPARELRDVLVCIRAEDVVLTRDTGEASSARNRFPATVESLHAGVPLMRVDLDCGFPLKALITRQAAEELRLQPGTRLAAWVKAPHVHLIGC
jgi:molybdate transport system ATP-binding protein